MLPLLCFVTTIAGQEPADSSDVFYKHLKISELTVTGVTGQTKMSYMPAPVSVVTPRELRSSMGTNIVDVISREPGVAQLTTGNGIAKPIIRGLGYNRVLVVSDGVRQEGQQWGDEHGVEVDAMAVHSAEILKGPASLMYGSDAMAGVLILHSEPTLGDGEMKASATSEYQSNSGLFDYSLQFAGNKGGLVWNGRYSEKLAHEYRTPHDGYVPGTQLHERASHLLLGIDRQWGHSHLKCDYLHLTPSMAEGERDELMGELVSEYTTPSYHKQLPFQQVKHYKTTWDNAVHLGPGMLNTIVAYQQNRRQEFEESPTEPELYFRLHTVTYDLRYVTELGKLETLDNLDNLDNLGKTPWKLSVGLGGMYQKSENLAEEALIPAYHLFDIGGYATAQKTLADWTFSGGLRADNRHIHHYGSFRGITGSLGTVWRTLRTDDCALNLRLNLARGFRAPNMSELGSDGVHEGTLRYEVGNSNLKPEYSWQADLGADFQSRYFEAQVSLFVNRIENYIFSAVGVHHETGTSEFDGYRVYTYRQGDALLKGFEASIDIHPIHSIHFGNTFSMVDARQLHQPRESRYLPMIPAPRWTSDLKYELTHKGKLLNNSFVAVGLECYLAQNHYYQLGDTETRTPSYTLLNMSAGTDICWNHRKRAELYLSAQNLLNRAYQSHLSRMKYTDLNVVTGHQGVYNPGRNITVKLVIPVII